MPALALPISTPRLVLRDFAPLDWYAVHAYASDAETMRFMFHEPRDAADARAYVERMLASQRATPRTSWELAVVRRDDGAVIGACDLTLAGDAGGDLGYVLARDCWGRGYATEAATALVRAGFEELGLRRIFATCDVDNVASARVLEKVGLVREGLLERHKHARGRWWTSWQYAIAADAWRAHRS